MTTPCGASRTLLAGRAEGELLVLVEPLSFWGGVRADTGEIIDVHHPQVGASVTGRIVAMPSGRGSSSSSSILAESLRAGTGPAAILLKDPDTIVTLGALVAHELYGTTCPVAVLDAATYAALEPGGRIVVTAGENVTITGRARDIRGS